MSNKIRNLICSRLLYEGHLGQYRPTYAVYNKYPTSNIILNENNRKIRRLYHRGSDRS